MSALREANHALGLTGERKKLLAEPYRYNAIEFAMQCEQWRAHARDPFVRTKGIFNQPAHRRERIRRGPHVCDGRKGSVQNYPADFSFGSERNGNSGAKRLAPRHDAPRRIARGSEVVGRRGVVDQAGLAWLACR